MIQKLAIITLAACIFLLGACGAPETGSQLPEFVPQLYSVKPASKPVRIIAFNGLDGMHETDNVLCLSNDYRAIAAHTLGMLNSRLDVPVECTDAVLLNGIVFINLGSTFDLCNDNQRALIIASLAQTFAGAVRAEYLMLYAGGIAVSFSCAPGIYVTPLALDKGVVPAELLNTAVENRKMLDNADDFALPALLWLQTADGIAVPCVRQAVMAVSFEQSVFNALCAAYDNGLYGVMDNKTIHVGAAELDGDSQKATFKILSNEKNINTDIVLLTMGQYYRDFSVDIRSYLYAQNANITLISTENVTDYNDVEGFLLSCSTPDQSGLRTVTEGVLLEQGDVYLSSADHCLRRALEYYGLKAAPTEALVYGVWDAGQELCVSISRECSDMLKKLDFRQEQLTVYSLVNTMCGNFGYSSIRILLDGKTVRFAGNHINTEHALHFAALDSEAS